MLGRSAAVTPGRGPHPEILYSLRPAAPRGVEPWMDEEQRLFGPRSSCDRRRGALLELPSACGAPAEP